MEDRIPLFGAFLREESHFFEEYNPKFKARLKEVSTEATKFLHAVGEVQPTAAPYLSINQPNIFIAVSRYFNDVLRLRTMHNISGVHRTKIAAYTAKWIWLNPVIQTSMETDVYFSLSLPDQTMLLNSNYLFVQDLIRYFVPPEEVLDITQMDRILHRFLYMMKVGVYEEHSAAALLETVDPIDGRKGA